MVIWQWCALPWLINAYWFKHKGINIKWLFTKHKPKLNEQKLITTKLPRHDEINSASLPSDLTFEKGCEEVLHPIPLLQPPKIKDDQLIPKNTSHYVSARLDVFVVSGEMKYCYFLDLSISRSEVNSQTQFEIESFPVIQKKRRKQTTFLSILVIYGVHAFFFFFTKILLSFYYEIVILWSLSRFCF